MKPVSGLAYRTAWRGREKDRKKEIDRSKGFEDIQEMRKREVPIELRNGDVTIQITIDLVNMIKKKKIRRSW